MNIGRLFSRMTVNVCQCALLFIPLLPTTAMAAVVSPALENSARGIAVETAVKASDVRITVQPTAVVVLQKKATDKSVTLELERTIRGQVARELASNPKLQGAWVNIVVPPDRGKILFYPIVDEKTAADQDKALAQFLKKKLPQKNYEILPHKTRPVSTFTQELQSMIEVEPTLGSCLITSAYYQTPVDGANAQALMLLGRVANNDQKAAIVRLSNELKKRPRFKDTMQTSFPKPDEMKAVKPSKRIAKQMFNVGRQSFRNKKYPAAQRAFDVCVLEDPNELMYRYWRVLAYIAGKDTKRAYQQLKRLARMRQANPAKFAGKLQHVMRSMERVQGPIRIQLSKLEKQALIGGPLNEDPPGK